MIPLQVTLEGFLSYEKKQIINFAGSPIWALCGPNGVGKSAVFDAITFVLFNAHRGTGTRGTPEDLINHRVDRLIVTFDFIVDGVIYRIKRIHPRKGKGRSMREAFVVDSVDTGNLDTAPTKRLDDTDSEKGLNRWVRQTIGMDYATFTSSCLLLQGKSERLLQVDPGERYAVLAELMDLLRYEQLCKAAEEKHKAFKNAVETLKTQLLSPAMRAISDVELEEARQQLHHAETEWQDAQVSVERFSGYLEQARHWEVAVVELGKQREELQNAQKLLQRETEIMGCFSELQELHTVLPTLRQIVEGRADLLTLHAHLDELQCASRHIGEDVSVAESKKDTERQAVMDLERTVGDIEKEATRYRLRLAGLGLLVSKLEQIEQLQAKKAELDEQIAMLPTDCAQQMKQAEQQLEVLEEKRHMRPWLSTFANARGELAATLDRERAASVQLVTLRDRYDELRDRRTVLQAASTEAQETERHLDGEKRSSKVRLQDAQKHLQRFVGVAAKPVCDLCGQEITGEHARREQIRLQQLIDECIRDVKNVTQHYQDAFHLKQVKEQELTAHDAQIEAVKTSYLNAKHDRQTACERAEEYEDRLREAFAALDEHYRGRIIGAIPEDRAVWLTTVYPSQSDIDTMEQEVRGRETQEREVVRLRDVYDMWQSLNRDREVFEREISEQEQALDINAARNARTEKNDIEKKQTTLAAESEEQQGKLEQAKEIAQKTIDALKELNEQVQQCRSDIHIAKARREEKERIQREREASLPVQWQNQATTLDERGLAALGQRCNDLSGYRSLYEQLTRAREGVERCQKRIEALDTQILVYPAEAMQPAKEVEEVLMERKQAQQQASVERDRLNGNLTRLKEQRERRQELEQRKLADERMQHLYAVLAKHLGKSGLQLYLLSRAERAIVDFANQTLSGLSHGRMRLELRRESDTQAQADKALDLVVYDRETGNHAVPIALVSGSQKFRIAVSLAMAIGRYMSRDGRHLESVIIDEGFGGLDKAGRDDMIQELHTLGEHVARIILVSHQEEFACAFPNRYRFKLVDGSSRVTLMDEE